MLHQACIKIITLHWKQLHMDTNNRPHVCSKETFKRGENSKKADVGITATRGTCQCTQKMSKIHGLKAKLSINFPLPQQDENEKRDKHGLQWTFYVPQPI